MWALFRFTRFGLATRGAAENERGAMLLGFSPDFHAGVCWVLATVLAATGGILVAPLTNLTPTGFTLLIVPALAAGLIGRFTSFGLTVVAALAIGVLQNILTNLPNQVDWGWLPEVGMSEALPFVLIVVIMFLVGKSLPERGAATEGRFPPVPASRRRILAPAVMFASTVLAMYSVSPSYRLALINTMIGAVVCLSARRDHGLHRADLPVADDGGGSRRLHVGGLTDGWGYSVPLRTALGGKRCDGGRPRRGIAGVARSRREPGRHHARRRLGIDRFVFNNPDLTGGFEGASVDPPHLFGVDLAYTSGRTTAQPVFGVFVLVVLTAVALVLSNLRRSGTGRRLLAVRTNERAATSMGVNVARTKFVAFGISSFIAGLAGTLIAYQQTHISAPSFLPLVSIAFLAIAFLGGITTVAGGITGGILVAGGLMTVVLDDLIFSRSANGVALQDLIGGIGLILTAILNPEGIAGAVSADGTACQEQVAP